MSPSYEGIEVSRHTNIVSAHSVGRGHNSKRRVGILRRHRSYLFFILSSMNCVFLHQHAYLDLLKVNTDIFHGIHTKLTLLFFDAVFAMVDHRYSRARRAMSCIATFRIILDMQQDNTVGQCIDGCAACIGHIRSL